MPLLVQWVILFAYLSLAVELLFFHVPSVASNVNIWRANDGLKLGYSPAFQKVLVLPLPLRIVLFGIPLAAIYATFAIPLLALIDVAWIKPGFVFQPGTFDYLTGVFLLLSGRAITFYSVLVIRQDNRQQGDSYKLHKHGVFSVSRNPGLVGMFLVVIGLSVLVPSVFVIVGALLYFAYMHGKVLMEEDFLTQKFGRSYLDYKQSTGRYLL